MKTMEKIKKARLKFQSEGILALLREGIIFSKGEFTNRLKKTVFRNAKIFDSITKIRYWIQNYKYNAPAHPFRLLQISPENIIYCINLGSIHDYGLGQVRGGDWDLKSNCSKLVDSWTYRGLKQRFEQNMAWEDTIYYKKAKQKFEQGEEFWGYNSLKNFRTERCEYVDNLYFSIRNEGYRPNYQGNHNVPQNDIRKNELNNVQRLEPLISISRNGELYLTDGGHRFIIAKLLGINSIPVNVLVRHKKWQDFREEMNKLKIKLNSTEPLQNAVSHPDLLDI